MNLVERDGWIFVRLEESERSADVDWHGLIRWKIPESERVYVPENETWIIRSRYSKLVKDFYFIYQAVGKAETDTRLLAEAQKVLERIDSMMPERRQLLEEGMELERRKENGYVPRWPNMYGMELN